MATVCQADHGLWIKSFDSESLRLVDCGFFVERAVEVAAEAAEFSETWGAQVCARVTTEHSVENVLSDWISLLEGT